MLSFKNLTIEDKNIIKPYITPYKFNTCEFSFATLVIWSRACNIEYTIEEGVLIIKKKDYHGKSHLVQLLGYDKNSLKPIVETLKEEKKTTGLDYLFKEVEWNFVQDLIQVYGDQVIYEEDRDNFDYIYESNSLITMTGKVLHKKRNHFNKFDKGYNHRLEIINSLEVREDCKRVAKIWHDSYGIYDKLTDYELEAINQVLDHWDLLDLKGVAVYVDNNIAGFSIGEIVNEEMAIIHFEKGDKDYSGVFAFINQKSTEMLYSDIPYINREDDMGLPGLRIAKMSYGPVKLEKKYTIIDIL
ncbi:hypothetical protein J2Z44_000514 [Clostridium punense]|uniref:Phosphatidylglycerol lysyltransferase C-terminal domain-containing protein n=1 Tax=Clostridium punense TaxID=1054297 RepID=A0ABS4K0F1_9CLOT|nr:MULTISPECIES: phosphatidylglycerol lysyltransferase domain-containing protein [Clostridium]EQB87487.1 hypothetical protein M918_08820 [Clostridium sp. BL8]MBP2020730.1 hypothetical protein [Clostridium punense]